MVTLKAKFSSKLAYSYHNVLFISVWLWNIYSCPYDRWPHSLTSLEIISFTLHQTDTRILNYNISGKFTVLDFKKKIRTSVLQISSLALYRLSYPRLFDDAGLNYSFESNAMQGVVVCDISHHMTGELTSSLFWCFKSNW